MSNFWQNFEVECLCYLIENYPKATYDALGQYDSTHSDIQVTTSTGLSFFIEIKSSNAQCGQFVLVPNEEKQEFDYSKNNKTKFFDSTKEIINYMNENFRTFINAGTSGENVELDKSIFYDWIKSYYSNKGVRFFITKSTDFLIFPIEKFDEYFDVSCCYRMKRSGSSNPNESNITEIKSILQENNIKGELKFLGNELYLNTQTKIDGMKLKGNRYTYLFRDGVNSNYLIRRLSNTCNSNVIFQISLKKYVQDKIDLTRFEILI